MNILPSAFCDGITKCDGASAATEAHRPSQWSQVDKQMFLVANSGKVAT